MAIFFTRESDYYSTPTPITAVPFTVGCWALGLSQKGIWTIFDDAAAGNWWQMRTNGAVFRFGCASSTGGGGGAAGEVFADGGSWVSGAWSFIICRAISATSRRIDTLNPDGSTTHAQETTSRTPSGVDTFYVGNGATTDYSNGMLAEFWYTATDIQLGGGAMDASLLRKLAYQGPFSVPHVASNLIEYRSYRTLGETRVDLGSEIYQRTRRTWTPNDSSITLAPHPPLPYDYRGPRDATRLAIV